MWCQNCENMMIMRFFKLIRRLLQSQHPILIMVIFDLYVLIIERWFHREIITRATDTQINFNTYAFCREIIRFVIYKLLLQDFVTKISVFYVPSFVPIFAKSRMSKDSEKMRPKSFNKVQFPWQEKMMQKVGANSWAGKRLKSESKCKLGSLLLDLTWRAHHPTSDIFTPSQDSTLFWQFHTVTGLKFRKYLEWSPIDKKCT